MTLLRSIFLLSFVFWACSGNQKGQEAQKNNLDLVALGFAQDSTGLWWRIAASKSEGDLIRVGDSVQFYMKVRLVDGSPVSTTNSEQQLQSIKIGGGQVVKGVEIGLCKMKSGEKAEFVLPPQLAYGSASFGAIQPNSTLRYTLEVKAHFPCWTIPEKDQYRTIDANGVTLYLLKEGNGSPLKDGDSIRLSFAGYLATGALFDRSLNEAGPLVVVLNKARLMPGLYQALTHMKRGSTVKAIIPPALGFGKSGMPPKIPANSTLYFDLTIEE